MYELIKTFFLILFLEIFFCFDFYFIVIFMHENIFRNARNL